MLEIRREAKWMRVTHTPSHIIIRKVAIINVFVAGGPKLDAQRPQFSKLARKKAVNLPPVRRSLIFGVHSSLMSNPSSGDAKPIKLDNLFEFEIGGHSRVSTLIGTRNARCLNDLHAKHVCAIPQNTLEAQETSQRMRGNCLQTPDLNSAENELLGKTRVGSVETDEIELDILPGSEIEDIWGQIKERFPWFHRMQQLMGTSPLVMHGETAHLTSKLVLNVLDHMPCDSGVGNEEIQVNSPDAPLSPLYILSPPSDDPIEANYLQPSSPTSTIDRPPPKTDVSVKREAAPALMAASRRKDILEGLAGMQEAQTDLAHEKLQLKHAAEKERLDQAHELAMQHQWLEFQLLAQGAGHQRQANMVGI
ncbi:hypothetical protein JB92DRAFT_3133573 [Gautieria morchelliformis]|nr:hypothetical protein JB92DRAFT_3133573 [Gautieria morchelliformis]